MPQAFAWLQSFRRVLVRYERLAGVYLALVQLAATVVCLRRAVVE